MKVVWGGGWIWLEAVGAVGGGLVGPLEQWWAEVAMGGDMAWWGNYGWEETPWGGEASLEARERGRPLMGGASWRSLEAPDGG